MDKRNDILVAISAREAEIWGYELNISVFVHLLSALPTGDVPIELQPYFSEVEAPITIEPVLAPYRFRVDIEHRLIREKIECDKARMVLEALKKVLAEHA